jgi:glycosyltransferase involved in cell wall biosynthesis
MKIKVGIYNLQMHVRGGGEKRSLALAEHLSRSHEVCLLVNRTFEREPLERYFGVDLERVACVKLNEGRQRDGEAKYRPRRGRWDTLTSQLARFRQIKAFDFDIFINNSYASNLPSPSARGVYMCMFPHELPAPFKGNGLPLRAYHSMMDRLEKRLTGCLPADFLDSYSVVTANSHFTAGWVRKTWGRRAEVIYSACDIIGPAPTKEKLILNVGRFVKSGTGALHKQQHLLLDVFKRLTTARKDGWQLHLAGSLAQDAESLALVERLEEAAAGLPVFFHFDAELDRLHDLYRRASIYWHATGYGFPVGEYPGMQEHFGMTTVEAMSAGAVPVVIDSGGQREIVTHAVNGFLWDDLTALETHTISLVEDARLLKCLSHQAAASSARFGRAFFNDRMDFIIERLMSQS